MNRTIKFRGRRTHDKQWVFGDLVHVPNGVRICSLQDSGYHLHDVDAETVGQYIGIPDTHGRDIYEGMAIRMLGDYWDVARQYKLDLSGRVEQSGTSWGIWVNGVFHGIDNTPWEEILSTNS